MSISRQLENYLGKLRTQKFNPVLAQDFLCFLRENQLRESVHVVKYGSELLKKYSSRLGDSVWTIYEQVFLAALDCSEDKLADECLAHLQKKFPNSVRVQRLYGMRLEAKEKYSEAAAVYRTILNRNNHIDELTMKRLISIARAKGDVNEAIKLLNEYLRVYMADTEAWQELAYNYLLLHSYNNAAFCYEELILASPENYHFYVKYAEILFTAGEFVNARKNFTYALELCEENNFRALYGLCLTTYVILENKTKESEETKTSAQLFHWASKKLLSSYQRHPKLWIVQKYIEQLASHSVVSHFLNNNNN
jgi:tetratricopeptide (TPR) repeat protein